MKAKIAAFVELLRRSGKLAPMILATTVLPPVGSLLMLGLIYQSSPWLRENPLPGAVLFGAGVTLLCGLSIMPTNILGMVGGWAFGFDAGLPLMMTAICCAALLSYSLNRRFVGEKFVAAVGENPKAKTVYEALVGQSFRRTVLIIFLLRLSPAMPFAMTNLIMAAARVPLKSFLLGTFAGMLPRTAAVAFVGAGLAELDFAASAAEDFWLVIFGIAATVVAVFVVGALGRRALGRLTA